MPRAHTSRQPLQDFAVYIDFYLLRKTCGRAVGCVISWNNFSQHSPEVCCKPVQPTFDKRCCDLPEVPKDQRPLAFRDLPSNSPQTFRDASKNSMVVFTSLASCVKFFASIWIIFEREGSLCVTPKYFSCSV
jgi:hypothetical protein